MAVVTSALAGKGRRLIAVLDFEFTTVADKSGNMPANVGVGMSEMLITELAKEGTYTVVERSRLEAVLKEQNLSSTEQFDPATAAEIGKLLGVDAVIVGNVTQFGMEKATTEAGGAATQLYGGVAGLKTHVQKAVVGLDVRMIDTKTAVIVAAASGMGVDKRVGLTRESRQDRYSAPGESRAFSDISQGLVGNAASLAIVDLTDKLVAQSEKVRARQIAGLVADVEGDIVVINIGRADGLMPGDTLCIEKILRVVKDPANPNKVLRNLTQRIALAVVSELDEKSAIANVIERTGTDDIKLGCAITVLDRSLSN